ncbi:DinB family protein [Fibrivirga algicola]|uniref:DinB family protein n=1 Tax=Fibrivirga algicola TaxID=2950420 RepID=A0ABX0QFN9_9BACT|nr:DinB family protein [Fibrivirga algicola]ARK11937.1 metal-dependent hydrolase [Fibrella sp. ES10-3-2-2]NID11246.1 DinB family protein [Fibrivirga algicola]
MNQPEIWLRGPLPNVPALLQPAAHALEQALLDARTALSNFPDALLWERPAGLASVGFHLQHIAGVQDRMLTYARHEALSETQFTYLRQEGKPTNEMPTVADLLTRLHTQTERTVAHLRTVDPGALPDYRPVGREGLPSTVGGLLFHAAEHSMRHVGQLLVTAKLLVGLQDRTVLQQAPQ